MDIKKMLSSLWSWLKDNRFVSTILVLVSIINFTGAIASISQANWAKEFMLFFTFPLSIPVWFILIISAVLAVLFCRKRCNNSKCLSGNSAYITIRRCCLPTASDLNAERNRLLPLLAYQRVDPDSYSIAFERTLDTLPFKPTELRDLFKKFADQNECWSPNTFPRIFLVCSYTPLEIIHETIECLWYNINHIQKKQQLISYGTDLIESEIKKARDDTEKAFSKLNISHKNDCNKLEFYKGNWWLLAKENNIELISNYINTAFPHFKRLHKIYTDIHETAKNYRCDNTLKAYLNKYQKMSIVRVLLDKNGKNNFYQDAPTDIVQHAENIFKVVNGDVPCYRGETEVIINRTNQYIPRTDFSIAKEGRLRARERGIEVWDFYEESHILLTHGRWNGLCESANEHQSGYEDFMNDWDSFHESNDGYAELISPNGIIEMSTV